MNEKEIIQILKRSTLFSGLEESFFQENARFFHPVTLKRHEGINDRLILKYFHIIAQGACIMRLTDPNTGKSIAPCLLREGEGFDLLCTIDDHESWAEYVSLEESLLLRIRNQYIRHWLESYPQVSANALHMLVDLIKQLEEFSESVVFYDVKTRLAKLILRLALKEKKRLDSNSVDIPLHLTHEVLAEMVGSVRSVVTTSLQALKKEGLIFDQRAHLIVQDLEKLKNKLAALLP